MSRDILGEVVAILTGTSFAYSPLSMHRFALGYPPTLWILVGHSACNTVTDKGDGRVHCIVMLHSLPVLDFKVIFL